MDCPKIPDPHREERGDGALSSCGQQSLCRNENLKSHGIYQLNRLLLRLKPDKKADRNGG